MSLTKPCPHCRKPMEIPQPTPEQIRCQQCGTLIVIKAPAPTTQQAVSAGPPPLAKVADAPTPVPPVRSQRGVLILLGVLAGFLLLGVCPVMVLSVAWLVSGDAKPRAKEDPGQSIMTEIPAPPPPPDPRIQIVQPSVDKGVAFIKTKVPQIATMRPAYPGLNGLTLLECGVPADDPAIASLVDSIRKAAPSMYQVYDIASVLFFLNRLDESQPLNDKDRAMARTLALRIIAGQHPNGIWAYTGVMLTPEKEAALLTSLRDGSYKPSGPPAAPSMSNTQFAMLATWGSRRHGVPVRDPLLKLADYFHANQQPDGHWKYPAHSLAATSTCTGLICLAMEKALYQEAEFGARPREPEYGKKGADVNKGFAFVAKTIGRKMTDPGAPTQYGGRLFNADAGGDLYFLWTLERVGMIYSKELIEGKNWYDWGYPIVMKAQNPDGSWHEGHNLGGGPHTDTCFALLFLKRANIARDLTEMIRPRAGN